MNLPLLIYTAMSKTGHTQLNACAVRSENGETTIYVVGGSSGNIFGRLEAHPGSDAIVVALDPAGTLLRGVQVPAEGSCSAASVAIEYASRDPGLLVAAQIEYTYPLRTTIAFHRLGLQNLLPLQEPSVLTSFGFVRPLSLAVSPRFTAETNQTVAFIAGNARISDDKKNDVVCEIHSRYGRKEEKVTLYSMPEFLPGTVQGSFLCSFKRLTNILFATIAWNGTM
jgi:hypothetical protein